jgi:hypothetical protein
MSVTTFLYSIAIKKGVKGAVVAVLPFVAIALPILESYGVKVTINEEVLTTGIVALVGFGIEFVRNWMKHGGKK